MQASRKAGGFEQPGDHRLEGSALKELEKTRFFEAADRFALRCRPGPVKLLRFEE